jgi:hypothetical protein
MTPEPIILDGFRLALLVIKRCITEYNDYCSCNPFTSKNILKNDLGVNT